MITRRQFLAGIGAAAAVAALPAVALEKLVPNVTAVSKMKADGVMKVYGLGFGTKGQFIEWIGPMLDDPSECREEDAIYYIKQDGSAYFAGGMSMNGTERKVSETIVLSGRPHEDSR